jgi:hypothetical protein
MIYLFADCVQGSTEGCCDSWQCALLPIAALLLIPVGILVWLLTRGSSHVQFSVRRHKK